MKTIYLWMCILIACPVYLWGQQNTKQVKGVIIDTENSAISNATVQSTVSKRTAVTDDRGSFELLVADRDTLRISSVGYRPLQYVIGNETDLRLVLEKADVEIEEVVVSTGYQQLKPNEVNGSVTVISREMLELQNGTNILERLDGVTNGLSFNIGKRNTNPQSNNNIMVRGHSTINGPLDPLIVLDHFVYEGDIENINPDDVESVTILKDASATSIYGARGGNGVIVITTKRGKFNQPVQVDVRASTLITDLPDLSVYRGMDNKDYIEIERMLYERGNFDADINRVTRPALTPVVNILNKRDKGVISAEEAERLIRQYENADFLKQYSDAFYQRGYTRQYHLGVRGGSERQSWSFSANLNDGVSTTDNPSKRLNLHLSNRMKVADWMILGVDAQMNNRMGNSGVTPSITDLQRFGSRGSVPYVLLFDEEGKEVPFHKYNELYLDTVGQGRLLDWNYYPVSDRKLQQNKNKSQELVGVFHVEVNPYKGVQLMGSYQYQRQVGDINRFDGRDSYFMRNMINRFAQINETTGAVTYPVPNRDRLTLQHKNIASQQFRLQSNYRNAWAEHSINGILGFEVREVKNWGNNATYYGYNADPLSYTSPDRTTSFPVRPAGSARIGDSPFPDSERVNRFVSLYGNAHYSFRDRYSLSASFRRDGSNIYGLSTNDKWKPLWSVGLGYEISKEPFFQSEIIDYLKVRSTLGYSGNVDVSRSAQAVAVFNTGEAALGSLPYAGIGTLNNPSLRWEQVQQINFGVDFRSFNNRLSGSLEYYIKESTDLYGPSPLDYTTSAGAVSIIMNAADLSGKGVDLQLRVTPISRQLIWNSSIIFNYNTSKVKKYHLDSSQTRSQLDRILETDGDYIYPIVGKALYNIVAYRWGGLDDEGDPLGYLNGELSKDYVAIRQDVRENGDTNGSARFVGTTVPVYFGSWLNDIFYQNISLSVNLTYRAGYYFRRLSVVHHNLITNGYNHPDFALRWQQPGDEYNTDVPAFIFPETIDGRDGLYRNGEHLIERADHIRLQFINLSYTLRRPNKYMPKSTRVFINASNLGILWRANKHNLDPDYPYTVKPSRTLSLGLSASF